VQGFCELALRNKLRASSKIPVRFTSFVVHDLKTAVAASYSFARWQ